jgi:hypothetical protein
MAKLLSTETDRQAEAEAGLKRLFKKAELPKIGAAPPDLSPDRREVWLLQQQVAQLQARYTMLVKIAWRTSAALVGLAAPVFGWDFIARIIQVLGSN